MKEWVHIRHRDHSNFKAHCQVNRVESRKWKVISRSEQWVLSPTVPYEQIGDVPGVVFPTGAVLDRDSNQLCIYYGVADKVVALATADLGEIIDFLKECRL